MKKIKFSIIIPSFNQADYIEKTLQSIYKQTYPFFEVIVMDGGSTDKTVKILKKYKKKYKDLNYVSKRDNGQSDAINRGFEKSSGDIIAWLNSDDFYTSETLSEVANYFTSNPKCYWLTGDYIIVDQNGKEIQKVIRLYKKIFRYFGGYRTLSVLNFIAQPSTFLKREVLEDVGYLNEDLHYTMDYDWWLRIIKRYPLCKLNKPLSYFRVHQLSKGGLEYLKQFEEELIVAKKHNKNKFIHNLHYLHNQIISFVYRIIK